MKKTLLLIPAVTLSLAAAVGASPASAGEPAGRLTMAFSNTVMSVYPDGRSQKIWLQPDGSWTGLSRRGNPLAGKWSLKGEKVCLRQTKPPTLPIRFCQAFPDDPARGVDARDLAGTPIHLKLVTGRAGKPTG